jgi:hypothetical protein
MNSYQLWLQPGECRQAVADALLRIDRAEVSVADVAREAFSLSDPDLAARTQIGIALAHLGWRRVEYRTKQPRYVWRRH